MTVMVLALVIYFFLLNLYFGLSWYRRVNRRLRHEHEMQLRMKMEEIISLESVYGHPNVIRDVRKGALPPPLPALPPYLMVFQAEDVEFFRRTSPDVVLQWEAQIAEVSRIQRRWGSNERV